MGSVSVAHSLSCPAACEIFLDEGSDLALLHWQVDSYHWTAREVSQDALLLSELFVLG